jgi:ethanolamine transporter EutH
MHQNRIVRRTFVYLKRPHEVSLDVAAGLQCLAHGVDVVVQVGLAHGVVHRLLHCVLLPGQAVLRHVGGDGIVAVDKVGQSGDAIIRKYCLTLNKNQL